MRVKHAMAMGLMAALIGCAAQVIQLDTGEWLGLRAQGMDYQTRLEPVQAPTPLIGAGVAADPFGRAGG